MNVNFYLSKLNKVAKAKAFKNISKLGNEEKIVVITPDRNTLNIEKEVIKAFGRKSIFNLNVTTFSRIAKSYLTQKGLYRNVLTKHASVALIKKIMLNIKSDLKVFDNSIEKDGFCEKIFETICLYKSCKVSPTDFYMGEGEGLMQYKLHDIALVYNKYEESLKDEYTDSFNQLDLFEKSLNKEDYNDVHFILVDFEDITPALIRVIAKLAKSAKSFSICTTFSNAGGVAGNKHIYVNDIYFNLINYFEMTGVQYSKEYVDVDAEKKNLVDGLYNPTADVVCAENNINLNLIKANNIKEELNYVVTDIKRKVMDKVFNFNDVALIVSDMETYKDKLEDVLDRAEISYYIDESETLGDNILTKIILWVLELACKGVTKYTILSLMDTGIMNLTQSQINAYKSYIAKFDAKGEYLYNIFEGIEASDELQEAIKAIKLIVDNVSISSGAVDDYKAVIDNVLELVGFDYYFEMLYSRYIEENDIINAKKLTQSHNKLSTIWQELAMLFKTDEFVAKEFYSVFKAFVEDVKLSLPPIKVDCLVVSDFESSYIGACKYIYFVGANEGALPKFSMETALLSDKELNKIQPYNRISPTINVINRRKKFKLFETVLKAEKELNFSYVCIDSKGEEVSPSVVYGELSRFIEPNLIELSDSVALNDANQNELISYNITRNLAQDNLVSYIKKWDLYNNNQAFRRNVSSIEHALSKKLEVDILANANYLNQVKSISRANKLYFKSSEVSPSQFERFASCPYSHFLDYGLKLRDVEVAKISTNDVGNLIHEYLKNVIYDLSNYKNDVELVSNIDTYIKDNFAKVLENKKYSRFVKSDINRGVINGLFEEVNRLTKAIIYQLQISNYEPYLKEYSFDANKGGVIALTLKDGKRLNVIGKVDRIDINKEDNTYLIIDYKTGNSNFANFTEFVAGKKIQLFTYLLLYHKESGMKPVGAFYLPINNKVESGQKYRYQGFFVNNEDVIGNIDNNLRDFPSSGGVLRLSKTKDGKFIQSNAWKNLAITDKVLNNSLEFLISSITERAEAIEAGVIDITPLNVSGDSACKYCRYKGICNYNTKYGNRERRVDRISSLEEILEKEEGQNV